MAHEFDIEEFRALRNEIHLRILIQNTILALLAPLFFVAAMFMLTRIEAAYSIAAIYIVCSGIVALMWAHSGARTLQIKTYLTRVIEPRLGIDAQGWEQWHARNRVAGVLGSRWLISTKGVIVGSQIAILCLPFLQPIAIPLGWPGVCGALGCLLTAIFLVPPRLAAPVSP
jgi:hypothetical protein